jgi:hypothetical protein
LGITEKGIGTSMEHYDDVVEVSGMTVEEMTVLCLEAFGKTWKSQLARELGVYNSTVNRWVTGYTPISVKNARAIRDACRQRLANKTSVSAA